MSKENSLEGIKKLRELTGVGFKDCKAALDENISKSIIDSTRCPIGLPIGAHSPGEIAVSICAEIISLDADNGSMHKREE